MKKETRTRFTWVVLFTGILVVGDRALASLLDFFVVRSQMRYSQLYRGGLAADVLALGNSRGVNAFHPPQIHTRTEKTCFNLSHNGMSMEALEALLLDYLERNAPPDVVFVEIHSVITPPSGALAGLRMYSGQSPRIAALCRQYVAAKYWGCTVSHLFRYNSELFLRALYYLYRSDQDWGSRYEMSPSLLAAVEKESDARLPPPSREGLAALRRIVRKVRESGARLELVLGPFLPAYRKKIVNLESWLEDLRSELGAEVEVHDYSSAVTTSTLFTDRIHLNVEGAGELLERMVADGLFRAPASRR